MISKSKLAAIAMIAALNLLSVVLASPENA
jgi:hypothetical protein